MRFRLIVGHRGRLEREEFYPTFRAAKSAVALLRRNEPELILTRDVTIEDTRNGTEWMTDQLWNLIEM